MDLSRNAAGEMLVGGTPLGALLDEAGCGTPAYVYDLDGMEAGARALDASFGGAPHLIAYALKANSAGPVVRALAAAGCGADVVSGGELRLALACALPPRAIVFSGVAKRDEEIEAALTAGDDGILALQVESLEELPRVAARARSTGRRARVSIRVNPGVEFDAHAHVATGHDAAKFGVSRADLPRALAAIDALPELALVGLSCHLGSSIREPRPFLEAARRVLELARARELSRGPLDFVDLGGGFAVDYGDGGAVAPGEFVRGALELAARVGLSERRLLIEPGRSLVASHGLLCARVLQAKRPATGGHPWLLVDAAMNDLLRPALYGARHRVEPLVLAGGARRVRWRVAGPVCESADHFGEHDLPDPPPSHVVLRDAGAYGFTMASRYNGRPLPAEVFVRGGRVAAVLRNGSVEDWVRGRLG